MAAAGQEATVTEPLKYKIWNIKVSIHCEGCKRKVKKVLQSIEGVYTTTVDPQKQKVTVTGNIEADILIKKLIKTGKHAELWPEPKPSNRDPNTKNDNGGGKNKKKKNGDKPIGESLDKTGTKEAEPDSETKEEEEGESPAAVESGKDLAKDSPKTDQNPAGKKKGKKNNSGGGNNSKNGGNGNVNNHASDGKNGNGGGKAAAAQDNEKAAAPVPHQQGYSLPMYHMPQYVVSYNNMQPVMAGSYYVPTMATVAAKMTGSYDLFSEENANACFVM